MLNLFIIALLLPSALSYSIKVKGTIEMGDQIADVLKELKDHLITRFNSGQNKKEITYSFPVAQKTDGMPEVQDFPGLGIPVMERNLPDVQLVDRVEVPLLEEIVRNKKEKVHVYGEHGKKVVRNNEPLNEIVV